MDLKIGSLLQSLGFGHQPSETDLYLQPGFTTDGPLGYGLPDVRDRYVDEGRGYYGSRPATRLIYSPAFERTPNINEDLFQMLLRGKNAPGGEDLVPNDGSLFR